jgi:hypothetical protein
MHDLVNEISGKTATLDAALGQLGKRGRELAQAEHDYRVALAEKILHERDGGMPVTIINDVCRGDRKIAQLKLKRDIAQTMYDTALEAINVYKLQVRVLENQIDREWHRS